METYTDDDVRQWAETVNSLHAAAVADQDLRIAAEAAANLKLRCQSGLLHVSAQRSPGAQAVIGLGYFAPRST